MKKKLLTTLAIVSVVLIAGCNCNEKGGLWSNGHDYENPNVGPGSGNGGSGSGTPGQLAPGAVNLGTAGNYVILAESGISTTGTSLITGDLGVSPIAAIGLTGFGLTMDVSNTFSTSAQVIGKVYASDYAVPTPANLTTAVSDMETAYTTANNLVTPAPIVEKGAGDISGLTLPAGLYKWSTGVLINGGVTLSGGANAVWIFQIAQNLTVGNGAIITLSGGAQAKNIFWVVAGQATLGTTVDFSGIILSKTLISLEAGAKVTGRLLAQTAVTLIANTITQPLGGTQPGGNGDNGNGNGCKDKKDNKDDHNGKDNHGDNENHNGKDNHGDNGNYNGKDNHGDNGNYNGKDKKDDRGGNKHFGQN